MTEFCVHIPILPRDLVVLRTSTRRTGADLIMVSIVHKPQQLPVPPPRSGNGIGGFTMGNSSLGSSSSGSGNGSAGLWKIPTTTTGTPGTSSSPPSSSLSTATAVTMAMTMPPFVVKAAAVASLGGVLFGYDSGVIAGALPQLRDAFDLTSSQQERVVGILYIGAGLGAAVGGCLSDRYGRKTTILATDSLFFLGALAVATSTTVSQLLFGRFVLGAAVAVSGVANVAYLSEIAPPQWRGAVVSVNEACIALGFLLAFVAGVCLQQHPNGWQTMFGMAGLLAVLQFVGIMAMPESPKWLQTQPGREQERVAALELIYSGQLVPQEELERSIPGDDEEADKEAFVRTVPTSPSSLWSFWNRQRAPIYITLFLAVCQQLCGQTTVLNYAPLLFQSLGSNGDNTGTLLIGLVKVVVTVLVIWKVEKVGRKTLLLTGMTIIAWGQFLVAFGFRNHGMDGIVLDDNNGNDNDGYIAEATSASTSPPPSSMMFALPCILLVVIGYSASFGPLTWLLTAELFSTRLRGKALGASTVVTYLAASAVTSTFLTLKSALGFSTVFAMYGLTTLAGIVFAHLAIPDTGGKDVATVHEELLRMWCWRSRRTVTMTTSTSLTNLWDQQALGVELLRRNSNNNNNNSDDDSSKATAVESGNRRSLRKNKDREEGGKGGEAQDSV